MLSAQFIVTVSISIPTCFLNFNLKKCLVLLILHFISRLVYVKYLETKSYRISSDKSTAIWRKNNLDVTLLLSVISYRNFQKLLMTHKRGIKIARRNINNLRYANNATLMAESKQKLLQFFSLLRVKEESEKAGLKLNIHKMKIMASSPITFWQIEGEKVETVTDFIFLGSKIIAEGDCSHEMKRCLLLGRKAVTILDSILKSRDITLPTEVHLVKTMVFPVVM